MISLFVNLFDFGLTVDNLGHGHYLNGNFLDFEARHPFLYLAMRNFVHIYKVDHNWGDVGPQLITTTLRDCLYNPQSKAMCERIESLTQEKFQYIQPGTLKSEFDKPAKEQRELKGEMMKIAYGLHFSNSEIGSDLIANDGFLHEIMNEYCPNAANRFENELFQVIDRRLISDQIIE